MLPLLYVLCGDTETLQDFTGICIFKATSCVEIIRSYIHIDCRVNDEEMLMRSIVTYKPILVQWPGSSHLVHLYIRASCRGPILGTSLVGHNGMGMKWTMTHVYMQ